MAIFRNIIVLGAVVALLPTDHAQQSQFYDKAANAVGWTVTFCDRNAALCAESQALWTTFVKKAEFGAGVVYTLVQQQLAGDRPTVEPAAAAPAVPRGTLRPDDLRPNWRGPGDTPRRGA